MPLQDKGDADEAPGVSPVPGESEVLGDLDAATPVTMTVTPVRLRYEHTASPGESTYLRGLADGRLIGQRCPACGKVYIPSRGTCPVDGVPADIALVDGNIAPPLSCAVRTVVKGDGLSLSIAAASIVAKVTRDRIMRALSPRYAVYGWETNVGYSTGTHLAAIEQAGVTRHHRRSFAPVRLAAEGPPISDLFAG